MEFVGQHCCYGKGAAQDMEIKDMKHSSAFHVSCLNLFFHHLFLTVGVAGAIIDGGGILK